MFVGNVLPTKGSRVARKSAVLLGAEVVVERSRYGDLDMPGAPKLMSIDPRHLIGSRDQARSRETSAR